MCSEAWYGEWLCSERPLPGLAGLNIWSSALSLWDLACHHPSARVWAGSAGTSVQSQLSSHQLHLSESFSALPLKPSWPSLQHSCLHFPFGPQQTINLPSHEPPCGKARSTHGFACGQVLQRRSNAESTAGLQPGVSQLRTQPIPSSPGPDHHLLGLAEGQGGWKRWPLSLAVSCCHQVSAALPSPVLEQLLLAMDATKSRVSHERCAPRPEHSALSRSSTHPCMSHGGTTW